MSRLASLKALRDGILKKLGENVGEKIFEHAVVPAALALAAWGPPALLGGHYPWLLWTLPFSGVAIVLWFASSSLQRAKYRFRVAKLSGVSRVYPVAPYRQSGVELNEKQRALADKGLTEVVSKSSHLRLLLASGFRHIGCQIHPGLFHEAISKRLPGSTLEVLLISERHSQERAKLANMSPVHYEEGRLAVLHELARLAKKHDLSIRVRCYDEPAIWQMVITDRELWLLCASDTDTSRSPVYCLELNAPFALAYGLAAFWDMLWDRAHEVELDRVRYPDSSKVTRSPALASR